MAKTEAQGHTNTGAVAMPAVAPAGRPSSEAAALVTRRELASALAKHPMTVTKWEQDGMPVAVRGRKGKPSLYDEAAVRAWLVEREEERGGEFVSLEKARIRKELSQARLNEQRLLVAERKLLPSDDVEKAWASEVAAVRTVLLAVPQTYADKVFRAGTLDGLSGVERALKEAMYEALRELAEPTATKASPAKRRTKTRKRGAA